MREMATDKQKSAGVFRRGRPIIFVVAALLLAFALGLFIKQLNRLARNPSPAPATRWAK